MSEYSIEQPSYLYNNQYKIRSNDYFDHGLYDTTSEQIRQIGEKYNWEESSTHIIQPVCKHSIKPVIKHSIQSYSVVNNNRSPQEQYSSLVRINEIGAKFNQIESSTHIINENSRAHSNKFEPIQTDHLSKEQYNSLERIQAIGAKFDQIESSTHIISENARANRKQDEHNQPIYPYSTNAKTNLTDINNTTEYHQKIENLVTPKCPEFIHNCSDEQIRNGYEKNSLELYPRESYESTIELTTSPDEEPLSTTSESSLDPEPLTVTNYTNRQPENVNQLVPKSKYKKEQNRRQFQRRNYRDFAEQYAPHLVHNYNQNHLGYYNRYPEQPHPYYLSQVAHPYYRPPPVNYYEIHPQISPTYYQTYPTRLSVAQWPQYSPKYNNDYQYFMNNSSYKNSTAPQSMSNQLNNDHIWIERRIEDLSHTISYLHEKLNMERKWLWQERIMTENLQNSLQKDEKEINQIYLNDYHSLNTLSSTHIVNNVNHRINKNYSPNLNQEYLMPENRSYALWAMPTTKRTTLDRYNDLLNDTSQKLLHQRDREMAHEKIMAHAINYKKHIENIEMQCNHELKQVRSLMNTLQSIAHTHTKPISLEREQSKPPESIKEEKTLYRKKHQVTQILTLDEWRKNNDALYHSYSFGKKITEKFADSVRQIYRTKTANFVESDVSQQYQVDERKICENKTPKMLRQEQPKKIIQNQQTELKNEQPVRDYSVRSNFETDKCSMQTNFSKKSHHCRHKCNKNRYSHTHRSESNNQEVVPAQKPIETNHLSENKKIDQTNNNTKCQSLNECDQSDREKELRFRKRLGLDNPNLNWNNTLEFANQIYDKHYNDLEKQKLQHVSTCLSRVQTRERVSIPKPPKKCLPPNDLASKLLLLHVQDALDQDELESVSNDIRNFTSILGKKKFYKSSSGETFLTTSIPEEIDTGTDNNNLTSNPTSDDDDLIRTHYEEINSWSS